MTGEVTQHRDYLSATLVRMLAERPYPAAAPGRPGQPTVDISHWKQVYVKCTAPTTTPTSLTSPVFDIYFADFGATFTADNPLLLTAQ